MSTTLNISGDKPENFDLAFKELASQLQFSESQSGMKCILKKGSVFSFTKKENTITLEYTRPIEVYRGLSFISQYENTSEINVTEKACFETVGSMIDVSRNAVLSVLGVKNILRKMALMGLNLAMMYTEDTYEVPEYPYFGYMRGRYTHDELKELDDYGYLFGIELCPCIQTLGHLNRAIHWPQMSHLADNDEILLVDSDETYEFLEKMIEAATKPYRSNRIHLGMDEAHGLGLGRFLFLNGYESPHSMIKRHLQRVTDITNKLGLSTMIWSDMYFRPDSKTDGYYDSDISQTAIDSVLPDVELVYWDYYHETEEFYDEMFEKHRRLKAKTAFAGAVWVYGGPAPDYLHTLKNSVPALISSQKANMQTVLLTIWGDNGAESNIFTALWGMSLYAEYCYKQVTDLDNLKERFEVCCQAPYEAFWNLSKFNRIEGVNSEKHSPVNCAKMVLYQDPMIQLYDKDFEGIDLEAHYGELVDFYAKYANESGEYQTFFQFYHSLAKVLHGKSHWFKYSRTCVLENDLVTAKALCDALQPIIEETETLRSLWYQVWVNTNKPFGFEVIDSRVGGLQARLKSAKERMLNFTKGTDSMEEFHEAILEYTTTKEGALTGNYKIGDIISACKING
ncbi:MAG: beta-N-acetylhexosaminidase [Eubacteriales bacterium]